MNCVQIKTCMLLVNRTTIAMVILSASLNSVQGSSPIKESQRKRHSMASFAVCLEENVQAVFGV